MYTPSWRVMIIFHFRIFQLLDTNNSFGINGHDSTKTNYYRKSKPPDEPELTLRDN